MRGSQAAGGVGIRFQPAGHVFVYENHGAGGIGRDLYTAAIQNIAFVNESEAEIGLDTAVLDVMQGGAAVQSCHIGEAELRQAARQFHAYQEQGLLEAYDFQFQTRRYLQGFEFARDTTLAPGSALVVTRRTLLFQGLPDTIRVKVKGHDARGEPVSGERELGVTNHASQNEYHFPVKGRWFVAGAPSLHSHHRWAILEEFALDLAQIGEGGLTHSGDGTKLTQFYAYGKPVYAMGDGVMGSSAPATMSMARSSSQ